VVTTAGPTVTGSTRLMVRIATGAYTTLEVV
jgi:hypothetical protein